MTSPPGSLRSLFSIQDLSMSMQLYWLYCTLAIISPQTAEKFHQSVANTLQSWVSPHSSLVAPHSGYQTHVLIIFGATLSAATARHYSLMSREVVRSYLISCFNKTLGCFCSDDQSQENDMRVAYTCVSVGYCYNLLEDKALFGEPLISYFYRLKHTMGIMLKQFWRRITWCIHVLQPCWPVHPSWVFLCCS